MLILIAGVSGSLGKHLVTAALEKGHQVRGFGRSPQKLQDEVLRQLESFVKCDYYEERIALDKAVAGVDAVICCYASHPDAILEAQLALLRAVERANIRIYHAHSWNSDWRNIEFGQFEHYDAYLAFRKQVQLTSTVRPIYIFTGILAEYTLNPLVGIGYIEESAAGKVLKHWGTGDAKWDFTFMDDAARFSIELLTTNKSVQAGEGGFFSVHSGQASAQDVATAYKQLYGGVTRISLGGSQELSTELRRARETTDPRKYFMYGNYFIQMAAINGTWRLSQPSKVGPENAIEQLFTGQIDIPQDYLS